MQPRELPSWQKTILSIQPGERKAVGYSFGWFFCIMCCYQLIRPIRESLVSELPTKEKPWLFLATFIVMLLAVPLYAWLVTKMPRQGLVHAVTHFFIANIVLFAIWMWSGTGVASPWLTRTLFLWVSVFNLFITSLFWSVMTDLFSNERSRRLFGPIASGATLGAIAGSGLATYLSKPLGIANLLMLSAGFLAIGVGIAMALEHETRKWLVEKKELAPSGGIFEGLKEIVRSRYLLFIGAYLSLFSLCGTTVYMQLTDAAKLAIENSDERTSFFAGLNLFTQLGTLIVQALIVGPVMRRLGLSVALIILPLTAAACFVMLGITNTLAVLGTVDVISRIATYGFSVPSREVLFTVVSREAKYKSKNFIDTIVIRGSDAVASSGYTQLKHYLPNVAMISWVMLPLIGLWIVVAWLLGQQQAKRAMDQKSN